MSVRSKITHQMVSRATYKTMAQDSLLLELGRTFVMSNVVAARNMIVVPVLQKLKIHMITTSIIMIFGRTQTIFTSSVPTGGTGVILIQPMIVSDLDFLFTVEYNCKC